MPMKTITKRCIIDRSGAFFTVLTQALEILFLLPCTPYPKCQVLCGKDNRK